jgi:hypothetical protein
MIFLIPALEPHIAKISVKEIFDGSHETRILGILDAMQAECL